MSESDLLEETPIRILPDIKEWSENFCLAGFAPHAGIDVFLHIGRWRKDLTLFREIVTIALPDGTILANRGVGRSTDCADGPRGSNLSMRVIEPYRRQVWEFIGAARRVSKESLLGGVLTGGATERLKFALEFSSELPIWDLASVGQRTEFMGRGHIEQLGRVVGEIKFGGETFAFDSFLNRDHSRGPRIVDDLQRHSWMHGVFENKLAFLFYEAETSNGSAYSEACVYDNGRLHPAVVKLGFRLPMTDNISYIEQPVPFTLEYAGKIFNIRAERFPTTISNQYTSPYEQHIGRRELAGKTTKGYLEQSVYFTLDDNVKGYGHMERTTPGEILRE